MRIEATVIFNRCVDYLDISDTDSRNQIRSILGLNKIVKPEKNSIFLKKGKTVISVEN